MKFSLATALCLFFSASYVHAGEKDSEVRQKQEQTQQRQQMAKAHEKMADCLKSNKEMSECRQQMQEECKKGQNCMMMDMGKMRGKGHMQPEN